MNSRTDRAVELLVVGAGPVGLASALFASRSGLKVEVIDQSHRGWHHGYAALLHPGSLRLFEELGIAEPLIGAGHLIRGLVFHADDEPPLRVPLPAPALAVAQARIEEMLLKALRSAGVVLRTPFQAATVQQEADKVRVRVVRRELAELGSPADFSAWHPIESSMVDADFVVGADGYDSRVRSALGIEAANVDKTEAFAMFEVTLPSDLGDDIHIVLHEGLTSVVVPLANSRVRLGFQLNAALDVEPGIERLRQLIAERLRWFDASFDVVDWSSVIHFERRLARRFGSGRVWLAGDAAHVTGPFGAQSMNSGLSEARELIERMGECIAGKAGLEKLERYGLERQREWHKLLGFHVKFDVLPNAPHWLGTHARRLLSALPVSGPELQETQRMLGMRVA